MDYLSCILAEITDDLNCCSTNECKNWYLFGQSTIPTDAVAQGLGVCYDANGQYPNNVESLHDPVKCSQTHGCKDIGVAQNHDSDVDVDDGSCIATIKQINSDYPVPINPFDHKSQYDGSYVITTGIITSVSEKDVWIQDGSEPRSAILLFYLNGIHSFNFEDVGKRVTVKGKITTSYSFIQLQEVQRIGDLVDATLPDPILFSTQNMNDDLYLGMFVKTTNVAIAESTPDSNGYWVIDDGSGNTLAQNYYCSEDISGCVDIVLNSKYTVQGILNKWTLDGGTSWNHMVRPSINTDVVLVCDAGQTIIEPGNYNSNYCATPILGCTDSTYSSNGNYASNATPGNDDATQCSCDSGYTHEGTCKEILCTNAVFVENGSQYQCSTCVDSTKVKVGDQCVPIVCTDNNSNQYGTANECSTCVSGFILIGGNCVSIVCTNNQFNEFETANECSTCVDSTKVKVGDQCVAAAAVELSLKTSSPCSGQIIQVTSALAGSTGGGIAVSAKRTVYAHTMDTNAVPSYTGGNIWPYVIAKNGFTKDSAITATVSIVNEQLLINGKPVYQYVLDTDENDANGNAIANWEYFALNGGTSISCPVLGCTDSTKIGYTESANVDDGTCGVTTSSIEALGQAKYDACVIKERSSDILCCIDTNLDDTVQIDGTITGDINNLAKTKCESLVAARISSLDHSNAAICEDTFNWFGDIGSAYAVCTGFSSIVNIRSCCDDSTLFTSGNRYSVGPPNEYEHFQSCCNAKVTLNSGCRDLDYVGSSLDYTIHDQNQCTTLKCTNPLYTENGSNDGCLTCNTAVAVIVGDSCVAQCTDSSYVENGTGQACATLKCTNPLYVENGSNQACTTLKCTDPLYVENGSDQACATLKCTDPLYVENGSDQACATLKCTDPLYVENGSNQACATLIVNGCMNVLYVEYNSNANTDNGSCATLKCTDPLYVENGSNQACATLIVEGCTDHTYVEYNSNANTDNGSCATLKDIDCKDPLYVEYDATANTHDQNLCLNLISTIEAKGQDKYDACATKQRSTDIKCCVDTNLDDTVQIDGTITGDMNNLAKAKCESLVAARISSLDHSNAAICEDTFDWFGDIDSAYEVCKSHSCCNDPTLFTSGNRYSVGPPNEYEHFQSCCNAKVTLNSGCRDLDYVGSSLDYTIHDQSQCTTLKCTNPLYIENGSNDGCLTCNTAVAVIDGDSCVTIVTGCTIANANNYNSNANVPDDNSCTFTVYGCTDPTAYNYNDLANTDDGSCIAIVTGCTDSSANNYNPLANSNQGVTCTYDPPPSADLTLPTYFGGKLEFSQIPDGSYFEIYGTQNEPLIRNMKLTFDCDNSQLCSIDKLKLEYVKFFIFDDVYKTDSTIHETGNSEICSGNEINNHQVIKETSIVGYDNFNNQCIVSVRLDFTQHQTVFENNICPFNPIQKCGNNYQNIGETSFGVRVCLTEVDECSDFEKVDLKYPCKSEATKDLLLKYIEYQEGNSNNEDFIVIDETASIKIYSYTVDENNILQKETENALTVVNPQNDENVFFEHCSGIANLQNVGFGIPTNNLPGIEISCDLDESDNPIFNRIDNDYLFDVDSNQNSVNYAFYPDNSNHKCIGFFISNFKKCEHLVEGNQIFVRSTAEWKSDSTRRRNLLTEPPQSLSSSIATINVTFIETKEQKKHHQQLPFIHILLIVLGGLTLMALVSSMISRKEISDNRGSYSNIDQEIVSSGRHDNYVRHQDKY